MEKIELNTGFILLKELKPNNITESGIYIPIVKWNRKFVVIESASELVNKNDIVFVEIGKGTDVKLNDENYLIYNEENIMAIVNL
ncbi:hypothetical protein [uncultured Methanobrevibacter sp.]|uniref:hypothetical protein n=1 Tax=uncultured Methanobrevibacter sp. TaxID=253161 RepID=UPI0025E37EA6|nr:hypothetical protein [uncultured Methanobrevibacter sp.]MBR4590259.1 hypothetical protein [Bacteroidaceae bacterium]